MNLNKNYIKKTIKLNKRKLNPFDFNFELNDVFAKKTLPNNSDDIYINIFLTKTYEIFEYVDIKKDENIYEVERQLINPYYIDFGFFDTIKRIKINNDTDLSVTMKNYLSTAYTESINAYNGDVKHWFNSIGYNMLVNDKIIKIDEVTGKKTDENGLDKLEKIDSSFESVISKAFNFPIDINK